MRALPIFAIITSLMAPSTMCAAEESDEMLARQMAGVVRDFRQPLATRVEAARTLTKLGARAANVAPDLVAVLDRLRGTEQEPLQEAVVEALGQMGPAARPALPSLAKAVARTADLDLAIQRTTDAILNAPDSQEIDLLSQQLRSRDASMRLRAAKALGDIGARARAAIPAITAALNDTDGDVRRAAITAWRLIQPNAKPTEALMRAIAADLTDPDPSLRLMAARTLGRIGPLAAPAAATLEMLRTDPDPDVRRAAAEAIARIAAVP